MQKILLTCCLTGSAILPAYAQTTTSDQPAAKPAPATRTQESAPVVPEVTVSAERPTNRIDRQVYDVKSDVSSTNGSAADALNNVPSVAVDPDGSVTLRGSSNVQIMVDGKPSAMLQGDNRGPALQALAADDIESIEVINNPGAQFGNEGGGGPILNLVMRRNRRPGGMGAVNLNAGVKGRYNGGVNGTYNTGRLTLQGGLSLRHDGRDEIATSWRERIDPVTGAVSRSEQTGSRRGLNRVCGHPVDSAWREEHWRAMLRALRDSTNARLKMEPLTAQDIQNCLCEFDKYERARLGEGRPKQKYTPFEEK